VDPSRWPSLDPELVGLVELLPDPAGSLEDVPAARELLAALVPSDPPPGEERLEISDELAGQTRMRVYRPRDADGDLPAVLHIHGGGFIRGSVELEHPQAVSMALRLRAVVVSVDYRLAPEHPYPAALDDCYAALVHLAGREGVDRDRIAVHGQSAGGALAAATALLARGRRGPAICFQVLEIPVLDDRLLTPSMTSHVATPMWSRPQAETSWRYYLGAQEADQYAAPARAADLSGLPPAYVLTCELDPLRDEGIQYAARLLADGVSVELHSYPGAFHGTALAQGSGIARRMEDERLGALGRALAARR
jgi:acetyl esterase/lipase